MTQSAVGLDVFFLLVGAVLVFSMHGGFAFLELGTVRGKNQVNALVKIIVDFAFSTLAYFFVGYWIAYGVDFFSGAQTLSGAGNGFAPQGLSLVMFFFLATFAAAMPPEMIAGTAAAKVARKKKRTRLRPCSPKPPFSPDNVWALAKKFTP